MNFRFGWRERFSKRHQEIDEAMAKLLGAGVMVRDEKKLREAISLDKRARKIQGIRPEQLRRLWDGQLSPTEKEILRNLKPTVRQAVAPEQGLAEKALAWAEEHLFDRHSVVAEHELWRHALEHARGRNLSVAELKAVGQKRSYIRSPEWRSTVTTKETLSREYQIVSLVHDGISRYAPFTSDYVPKGLAPDQRQAVVRILNSRNFVTLFRGGAGTGKSFALQAVNQGLERVTSASVREVFGGAR